MSNIKIYTILFLILANVAFSFGIVIRTHKQDPSLEQYNPYQIKSMI